MKRQIDTVQMEFLEYLVGSDRPEDWLEAARSIKATEKHLLAVARKCVGLSSYYQGTAPRIAKALAENAAATEAVMRELVASVHPTVWLVVADAKAAGEPTLLLLARKCVGFQGAYGGNSFKLSRAISRHAAATEAVRRELMGLPTPAPVVVRTVPVRPVWGDARYDSLGMHRVYG